MTQEQATAQISLLLQPECEPTLTTAEVSAIVDMSARVDSNGTKPSTANWIPTYDVYAGAALGWKIKAAKAAGAYQFQDDTLTLHREQIAAQCLRMANEYRTMTSTVIRCESNRETALRRAGLQDAYQSAYAIIGVYDVDDFFLF